MNRIRVTSKSENKPASSMCSGNTKTHFISRSCTTQVPTNAYTTAYTPRIKATETNRVLIKQKGGRKKKDLHIWQHLPAYSHSSLAKEISMTLEKNALS